MKKQLITLLLLLGCFSLMAQERMYVHHLGNVMYSESIDNIDSIKFRNQNSIFNTTGGIFELPISDIDSITFGNDPAPVDSIIYIVFSETAATVINPFSENGVSISVAGNHVTTVSNANLEHLKYHLSGTTANGSLSLTSDLPCSLFFDNLNITNPNGPVVDILSDKDSEIVLVDNTTNVMVDGSASIKKAVIQSVGNLTLSGNGTANITANKRNGIYSDNLLRIEDGTINIVQAVVDGLHAGNIAINGGMLNINANGDGIDGDTGCIDILDGEIIINTPSAASSAIKCDSTLSVYGGTMQLTVSGDQSKGFNSNQNIIFNGGTIDITASGTTVLVPFGSGFDPSYCTAIKCDGNCTINEAFITIVNTSSNKGGKGISADGDIIVNGGNLDITTNGGGEIYSNISGIVDAYTSACLKSKSNISILGGTILCSSTGIGGKGIGADLNMVIGNEGADNDLLHLTVATSGERFLVSGTDYANPKAVKSEGMMTINSGTITVTCTQNNDGGKAVESETAMVINGGNLEIIAFDDGLKTTSDLTINGGTIFCQSNGGDGIDCDGALTINGGTAIVRGADGGKGSFDCPENQFTITGGLLIGTAGSTGIPTENLCTQRSIIYTGTAGDAVSVTNADGNQILVFQMPEYSESSEPEMVLFFSSDEIAAGNGYTFHYGGTITGGTEFHGLYTNADYSGSNTIAFNVNSMVTFVEEVKQATLWMMFHDGTTQTILIDDSGKIYFEELVMKIEDGLGNLFSFDCNIIRKLNFQPGTAEITDMASFKNHIISKTSKNL